MLGRRERGRSRRAARARRRACALLGFEHEELIDRDELRALVPAVAAALPRRHRLPPRRRGDPVSHDARVPRARPMALGATVREGVRVTALSRTGSAWRVRRRRRRASRRRTSSTPPAPGPTASRRSGRRAGAARSVALMLMITAPVPPFVEPVVIRDQPHAVVQAVRQRHGADRRRPPGPRRSSTTNRTTLDFAKLANSAQNASATLSRACAARRSCAPGPVSRRACRTTSRSSARARRAGAVPSVRILSARLPARPAVGAIVAELVTRGTTNMPIEPFSIRRFQAMHQAA